MDLGIRVFLVEYTRDGERLVAASSKVSLSRRPVGDLFSMGAGEVEEWVLETYRRGHFSPWEHSVYTFVVDGLSRIASHQLVRHRIASYTQLSHRYSEGRLRDAALEACRRAGVDCPRSPRGDRRRAYEAYSRALGEAAGIDPVGVAWIAFVLPPLGRGALEEVARGLLGAASLYYRLLASGARREDARYALPGSLRTRIVATMNARELVQSFLPLRMCTKTQWELRYIAWSLWRELVRVHPRLFRWAGPSCVLRENTSRKTPATLQDYLEGREGFTIPRCPELVDNKAIPPCLRAATRIGGIYDSSNG